MLAHTIKAFEYRKEWIEEEGKEKDEEKKYRHDIILRDYCNYIG